MIKDLGIEVGWGDRGVLDITLHLSGWSLTVNPESQSKYDRRVDD